MSSSLSRNPRAEKPAANYARVYETLGVHFHSNGDPVQLRAEECPFCFKEKFYVNRETGQYDCKQCGESGNVTKFLTHIHREYLVKTTTEDYRRLSKLRDIPVKTLKRHEFAYMKWADEWLIPFKSSIGYRIQSSGQAVNVFQQWLSTIGHNSVPHG
jgi:hypothetical protein